MPLKQILDFLELFSHLESFQKNKKPYPILSNRVEPEGPTRISAGPASRPAEAHLCPAEADRPQRSWPPQHGCRRRPWLPCQAKLRPPRPLKLRPSPPRSPYFYRHHPCLASAPSPARRPSRAPPPDSPLGSASRMNRPHQELRVDESRPGSCFPSPEVHRVGAVAGRPSRPP
jgi:hypothetical protein